jgi:hypothetical protein
MVAAFVLVHSPVTGPSTWRWVASELSERGHQVVVPAVPPAATALGWAGFVGAVGALAAGLRKPVVVGHSGAGPLLPRIAARIGASALVFVDADIPPEEGAAALVPAEFLDFLHGLAAGGMLPPWSEWFGADSMRALIPDDEMRAIVGAEMPALPLSYFETRVPVPAGWTSSRCGYVLLSAAYDGQADKAEASGWPVVRLPGAHLDIVTRPAAIADAILSVAQAVSPADAVLAKDGRTADGRAAGDRPAADGSTAGQVPGSGRLAELPGQLSGGLDDRAAERTAGVGTESAHRAGHAQRGKKRRVF